MKDFLFLFIVFFLVSCGKKGEDGKNGVDGATQLGLNGFTTGVDMDDIAPGLACANGGVSIYTFHDSNTDGIHQSSESIIKVKSICHGLNGSDGTNGQSASITVEGITSSATCPSGGVKISSASGAPVEICNGVNGLNGEQGLPWAQGIPGIAGVNGHDGANGQNGHDGADGTIVTPVKFCPTDNSTFPEYGLMIGGELFAVFWGTTPGSPNTPQAYLSKLVAGNYQSTGGNNCIFAVQ